MKYITRITNIICASWRGSTTQQYEVSFCNKRQAVATQSFSQSERSDGKFQTFNEIDQKPKRPFAGESGILFKNMLDK